MFKFKLQATALDSSARAGEITTDHGVIQTPIFMPVGTVGSVKGVHQRELKEDVNAQIILGNTYHLYLRPGTDIIEKAGGLHRFINWDGSMLTDSGGYQVYSLSDSRKITEEGVTFKSHIDGSKHLFTPESAIDIQRKIGADIIMAFDECPPYPSTYEYAKKSMELTHRWLVRCQEQMKNTQPLYGYQQVLFPIVQGSTFKDLRTASAQFVAETNSFGNAIGGLSVGEPAESMYETTELVCGILPKEKPRYLMGVGTPVNLLECIHLGVDMFDCVLPSRNARHGLIYTQSGIINIKNAKWKNDFSALDENGPSDVSKTYSKAYLRHLVHCNELLGAQIATIHNLSFFLWLVREARKQIINGTFASWKQQMVPILDQRL